MKKKIASIFVCILFIAGVAPVSGILTNINIKEHIHSSCGNTESLFDYYVEMSDKNRDWSIIATYPIPESASGLAYDGTYLYCGIYGADGDRVYQINPSTGSYLLLCNGPQDDAFGLTYDGVYLWTTHHPSTPAVALQLDMSGNLISQFDLPDQYMSGIAYDAGDFWVATYYPDDPATIYKVDTSGNILQQIDFDIPGNTEQPWDLCLENGDLWIADYYDDALYKIDPSDGSILDSHSSEYDNPAGIVWDGSYLWYCDEGQSGYDYLYKVDLAGSGTPEIYVPTSSHYYGVVTIGSSETWDATVENIGTGDLEIQDVTFTGTGSTYLSCTSSFPITVTPGNQVQLPLVYTPLDFGELDATASIESNDPVHPTVDITLTGNAVYPGPDINLPESSHDYGTVRVNAYPGWLMEIENAGDAVLTINDITSDDSHFIVDDLVTFPFDIPVLSSVQIGIWFHPAANITYSATLSISSNDPDENPYIASVQGTGFDMNCSIGETLWEYQIYDPYDSSPKAIAPIPDVNGDGMSDVIIGSEDDYVRCFNGNAHTTGDVIWEHEIYSGSLWDQKELAITEDINSDGYSDIVVGTPWGSRSIITLSGRTGEQIWIHDTHEYGDGGWVYQVDCSYDYNDDGVVDVLANTGDDGDDTGPKRVYCLDALTGISIWERPVGGPGFSVIGIEDFTGDGQPDVLAGASNEDETIGYAFGINGATGSIIWTFTAAGSSVWALEQIGDITSDGIKDVIVGDFYGNIYGLDATTGGQIYSNSVGSYNIITRFEKLNDVNGDNHPDIVPAMGGSTVKVIDGQTGGFIWSHPVADQPKCVARSADINGDGIDDVFVGTLYVNNYCYFLSGTDGSELYSESLGYPVDAIAAIPDIVGDGSMEMVAGLRNGEVFCKSGGFEFAENQPPVADFTYTPINPTTNDLIQFSDTSTDSDGSIVSWHWDFGDGNTSSMQNPSHSFQNKGTYSVSLMVTDNDGDFDTKSRDIYVNNFGPNAAFSYLPTNPIKDETIQFTDGSYDTSSGSISSWYWEFGDGDTSLLQDPTHSYSFNGSYQVNLTVTNDTGIMDSISKSLYVGLINVDISLISGWNLITVPAQTGWWASDMSDNLTGCTSVSRWDSINQTYKTYIVGGPPTFDFIIEPGCGYFVDMTEFDILSILGHPINSVYIPLEIGWNLLGWYHTYDTTAISLSENITGCTSVSKWNATMQTYNTYIVGGPPTFDFMISRGMGLFVDVTEESVWYGDG